MPSKHPLRFKINPELFSRHEDAHEEEEQEQQGAEYNEARVRHELRMLRNPVTNAIPADFRIRELEAARVIPAKRPLYDPRITGIRGVSGTTSTTAGNEYAAVGPNNIGGRIRTLAFDRRNPAIMLTGGVTGGIFRSTDGGASWNFVLNENDIRSVTTIAQDPINPDVWYCGTGEAHYPSSAGDVSNGTFGWGIFKSTDNGVTWTKLPATVAGNNEHTWGGNAFDMVHRIVVHPVTGHVYAAIYNRIARSTNGGQTWEEVLVSSASNTNLGGITELYIPANGTRIFAAFSGENRDRAIVGVWESATGAKAAWKRIAGGTAGQPDSVAGWKAYRLNDDNGWSRVVLTMNRAGNKLFVLYKNGEDASVLTGTTQPEADLFRCDVSSGNPATYVWTNLSSYVPDEPNFDYTGVDPYTTYFSGYTMAIAVKPDNDNILFIGGTSLHRVHLNETTAARKFRRIGGYGVGFFPQTQNFFYPDHHPDIHWIIFPGTNTDRPFTASDGGIHQTSNSITSDTVRWNNMNTNLQTLQYLTINIHPDTDADFIIGGAQDNGTPINFFPQAELSHQDIGTGDGGSAALSSFRKNGNTWEQSVYWSVVQGRINRWNYTWQADGGAQNLTLVGAEDINITPSGLNVQEGQYVTQFLNDPDSTEHLYYSYQNRLYRTKTASTVTATSWTQLAGLSSTVSSGEEFTAMAISKRSGTGIKHLYLGTDTGRVYRIDNANFVSAAAAKAVNITPPTMAPNSYVAGISVNPRNADTALVVVSNYTRSGAAINHIFWTGNATAPTPAWRVIDAALAPVSSQSCAIVVKNSGVEYYVGTSVGLYSTTAINGNNTVWLNEGNDMLKKAIVRSIINRQQDNTMVIGTHGNGAFLTRIGDAVKLDTVTSLPPDTATNDNTFISAVYPTLASTSVQYRIGNMSGIQKILVQVYASNGQLVYQEERAYQNGTVGLAHLARGPYILAIYSDDRKHRHVQKLLKQ